MLFAGLEVRIVKNCDRGLESAARGPEGSIFKSEVAGFHENENKTHGKELTEALLRPW